MTSPMTKKERIEDLKEKYYEARKGIFVIVFFFVTIGASIWLAIDRWKAGDGLLAAVSAIIAIILFWLAIFFVDMFTHAGE